MDKLVGYAIVDTPTQLESFAYNLTSCRESMFTMGFLSNMNNPERIRQLLAKIPIYLRCRFRRENRIATDAASQASIDDLIWVVTEAAREENDYTYQEALLNIPSRSREVSREIYRPPQRSASFDTSKEHHRPNLRSASLDQPRQLSLTPQIQHTSRCSQH